MYYLVHIRETGSIGGNDRDINIIKRSKDSEKLIDKIKKIAKNATKDEDVEFINGYEREEFNDIDFDDIDGSLEIMHYPNGMCMYDNDYYQISMQTR